MCHDCVLTYTYVYACVDMWLCIYMRVYIYIYACIDINIHKHTHIYMYYLAQQGHQKLFSPKISFYWRKKLKGLTMLNSFSLLMWSISGCGVLNMGSLSCSGVISFWSGAVNFMQSQTTRTWSGFQHNLAVWVSVSMQLKTAPAYGHSCASDSNLVRQTVSQTISQPASEPVHQAAVPVDIPLIRNLASQLVMHLASQPLS